jgi:hypothetical protein
MVFGKFGIVTECGSSGESLAGAGSNRRWRSVDPEQVGKDLSDCGFTDDRGEQFFASCVFGVAHGAL